MSPPVTVGIFSHGEDLHAHLVADHIRRSGHNCHHIATDRLAYVSSLSWSSRGDIAGLLDIDGNHVDPANLDTVWWRRVMGRPVLDDATDAATRTLIPTECRAALAGIMFVRFKGRWVNDPAAEVRADNKLVQLNAASSAGFAIPETLVSAIPEHIRAFVNNAPRHVVVKVVRGTAEFSIPTRQVTTSDIAKDSSLQACPAIYQELVTGTAHLRVHVFGDDVIAIQIESPHLDWRPDLEVPMRHIELDKELTSRFSGLVRDLGLEMGIIDAKVDTNGQLIFLEINPQGQFLFIEGLTAMPLSQRLAAFLTATF